MGDRSVPVPEKEQQRLETLRGYSVLDTLPERAYDDITLLASVLTGTPIALISLIDEERQWFKSKVGLDVTQTPRNLAFCAHAILDPAELLVVPDAVTDARFAGNPLVNDDPNIRFYAGAPLVASNGTALGTLCVIDRKPRDLTAQQLEALRALSRQAMAQLELRRVVAELETVNARLQSQSLTDGLTGLNNRRAFDACLAEEIERAKRYALPLSLLILDVDHFKAYNDAFGHPAGDQVLRTLGELLQRDCRESDLPARYGGEEFAVILPQTGDASAFVMAERFYKAVTQTVWPKRPIEISLGVATLVGVMGAKELVKAADTALYEAKTQGRNRVAVYR